MLNKPLLTLPAPDTKIVPLVADVFKDPIEAKNKT